VNRLATGLAMEAPTGRYGPRPLETSRVLPVDFTAPRRDDRGSGAQHRWTLFAVDDLPGREFGPIDTRWLGWTSDEVILR
jgi:hypothetical protein